MQPLVLIAGFRRSAEICRVIDAALASELDVVVSLDRPREGNHELVDEWENVVRSVKKYGNLKDIWQYNHPLGCGRHLQTAIGSAFTEREEVIILEDDTLPSAGFFEYCKKMLPTYRDKSEVGMICGSRHVPRSMLEGSFFSHWPVIWVWAAWRRTWELYEPSIDSGNCNIDSIRNILPPGFNDSFAQWLSASLKEIKRGSLDTWDIQLAWALLKRHKLNLYPSVNLVTNIGRPGKSASNKVTFDHTLFRARYTHDVKDNYPTSVSIRANQWYAQWLTPSYLFNLQAELDKTYQDISCTSVATHASVPIENSRELHLYFTYYIPLKIRCIKLLKSLHIYYIVRKLVSLMLFPVRAFKRFLVKPKAKSGVSEIIICPCGKGLLGRANV